VSIWTHIAGLIRVDWLPLYSEKKVMYFLQRILSKDIPMGSEGGIKWRIQRIRDSPYPVLFANIVLWGDLRDFGISDIEKIEKWLKKVALKMDFANLPIRQGVVEVQVEFQNRIIYYYQSKQWRKIEGSRGGTYA